MCLDIPRCASPESLSNPNDPNDGELPKWPRFDPASRAYLEFSDPGPRAKEGLRRPQCDLFIEHLGGPKAK